MRTSHQLVRRAGVIWAVGLVGFLFWNLGGAGAGAKTNSTKKDKADATATSRGNAPPGVTLNACGCYRKGESCMCTSKSAKCECPGDCEPVGCDEKRQKEMDREVAVEVKRAEDDDKKRQAAEAESQRKAAEAEAAREKAEEGGGDDDTATAGTEKPAEPADDRAAEKPEAKDEKAAQKPAAKPLHKGRAAKKSARSGG